MTPSLPQEAPAFPGVRIARETDEVALFSLLTLMHAENGLFPMAPEKVLERMRLGTRGQGGVIGVIDGPEGIEASIGLFISQFYYTNSHHLEDAWSFVHPDHRHSTHAKRLLQFAKWTQKKMGIPLLTGVLTRIRLAPKMRLYQRELTQAGAIFLEGFPTDGFFEQRAVPASSSKRDVERAAAGNRPHRAA